MSGKVIYTSHPVQRFSIGEWEFEKGLLEFESEEAAAAFEAVLSQMPKVERNHIRKIDTSVADRVARAHIANQTKAIIGGANSESGMTMKPIQSDMLTPSELEKAMAGDTAEKNDPGDAKPDGSNDSASAEADPPAPAPAPAPKTVKGLALNTTKK